MYNSEFSNEDQLQRKIDIPLKETQFFKRESRLVYRQRLAGAHHDFESSLFW